MEEFPQIFFNYSPKMSKLKTVIQEVAKTDMTVLIKGESGTGKEFIAKTVHLDSPRREKPFIKVNCAALPKTLLESELFGFERGAFTGAQSQKPGKFELANEGTILLNDINEMDFSVQAKLLQVLQNGEFYRLGGGQTISVDARVVTTTKDHLEQSTMRGQFRPDLFYRINVVTLTVPPLRDRREQILPFIRYYLNFYQEKYGRSALSFSLQQIKLLQDFSWPGNIRELESMVKRFVLFGNEEFISRDLTPSLSDHGMGSMDWGNRSLDTSGTEGIDLKGVGKKAAEAAEKGAIQNALQETHWNRKKAAKLLRVSYKALLYKIQKYRLNEATRSLYVEEEI